MREWSPEGTFKQTGTLPRLLILNSISVQPKALELPQSLSASEVLIIAEGHEALLESVPKLSVCKKLDLIVIKHRYSLSSFFRLARISWTGELRFIRDHGYQSVMTHKAPWRGQVLDVLL